MKGVTMRKMNYTLVITFIIVITSFLKAQVDPDTAQEASIDRFSMEAGNLFVRDDTNGFPGPNEPINFDMEPFITKGLGNEGELIAYYNFDVMPTEPAPIYVLVRDGESSPVEGQLNIIDVIPGDAGYNDFWDVHFVTVPADYVANTITSFEQIMSGGYTITEMDILVNCPVVPDGSTAEWRLNGEDPGLTRGWYKNQVVYYFNFSEKALTVDGNGMVPLSPIYVTFNINPDQPGGGPPSGFVTEELTGRAHNVVATLPDDEGYSPLWSVNVYNNTDFENVSDLQTALTANILATGVANVNCPVVAMYVKVDRFSGTAGNLFVRDETNGLPGPNEPINFDQGEPFITKGLGPDGELISYYNFDVMPTEPAPIFVLIREGESSPVEGQMNIINVIPGDVGYNDFWDVHFVTVPADYAANTITSYEQIMSGGYTINEMTILVNCPVVPEGSTADLRLNGESPELTLGWYKGQVVYYFNFSEKALTVDASDMVPLSPIYVTFNINPDQPGGGPPSGFRTDASGRAHNVVATLPDDEGYSPLWSVNVYDNADFENVSNLQTALSANILATGVANVNCPVVSVSPSTAVEETDNTLPQKYALSQNFPNPFNPSTEIRFSIVKGEHTSFRIYNLIGEEVARLVNEVLPAGNYSVEWNAGNVPSGIYIYTITTDSFNDTKKMILLK
jgi:hypothetical protein